MINLSQIQLKSEDNNMDSQFLSNYQQIFKQQQKSFTMQEGVEIQLQLSERQVDRSRQRQLFEQQNNKLQNSHHGDSEIQEQSIYDGTDNTFFELKQQRSIAEGLMLKANVSSELNQYPNNNQNMNEIIFRAQNNNVDDSQQKLKQNQNDFDNTVIFDKEILQQLTSNDHPSDIKSINVQDQTNIFLSQNLSNNAEKMSQVAKNSFQSCGKRKNIFNNEVWLQDDIFFEKNFQKQETKIASVFKKQYQINQNSNRSPSNYKQNFLIATNIINRVLNTSLCRVAKIRQHVQNFITILKLRHFNKRIDDLNINDYLSINDLSHFQILKNKKTQNSKISFLIKFFEKISKVIPIFMPTDSARIIWDMIQVMFTYSFLYIYSLFIFFDQLDINTQFINRLILYSFIIFLVDIIISLNTAIFNKDSIIVRRRLISKQYFLSTTFVTDFLSMFVLSLKLFSSNQFTVTHENDNLFKYGLNSLIFLKLNGISQKKKRFDYIFTLTENQKHIIKLIKQIASVMTAAHIAAIGWYFLGVQEIKSNQSSWLDKIGIQNNLYYEKYAYSIYWYLIRKGVDVQLKSRVRNYLQFLAHEQKDRDKQAEDKILSALSNKLREEIISQINQKLISNYFVFISNFSQTTLSKLLFLMEEVQVNPNEVIISDQEQDDSSIYFIQNGIIEIYQQQIQKENKVNVIKVLKDGQVFGELSFFSGLQRQASARSVNLSTLYKIRRDQFIEILKENVEDFERFKMIQDQIAFQNELSSIHIECYNCKNMGHIAIQCPRIHKVRDQQFIILKQNYSNFQERVLFNRNKRKQVSNTKNQFQKNNIICNILKLSLKQQNDQRYLLFNTQNEIFTSEEYSISQSLTEEEDEGESSLQMQSNFEDQTINSSQKIFQKAFTRKKTEQFQKNQKKTSNIYSQNTEENQFNISQEKISENNQSNQENYEQNKITSNIQPSDVKISSLEVLDNFNSNNPNLHFRQKLLFSQQCKTIQKKEQDNQCQSDREIKNYQSDDKKESVIASFKKLDQLNTEIYNQMNQEQQNYIKFLQEQILLQNKIFNCLIFKNELPLIQQLMFQSNKQDSKDTFQKQNTQDIRKNSVKNDNQVKKNSFIQLIRDLKEKRLSNSGQNLNQLNYQNIQDKQNNFILNQMQQQKQQYQQQQLQDKACNLNQNTQYTDKIYSNLQDSSIPFILQFSNCKTFFNTDSDNSSIIINQFDKIDHFKRYFPHNNFLRVNQRLKQYQIEQKKLKKNNQCLKQRRLGLSSNMTTSVFQGNFNIIRFFPQDYNINLYKPTYLSYGVKMQQGNIFPKNFKLQKN
ncbi:hypothetical protein ABPG73_008990 [Tetrahymena malaccensis]